MPASADGRWCAVPWGEDGERPPPLPATMHRTAAPPGDRGIRAEGAWDGVLGRLNAGRCVRTDGWRGCSAVEGRDLTAVSGTDRRGAWDSARRGAVGPGAARVASAHHIERLRERARGPWHRSRSCREPRSRDRNRTDALPTRASSPRAPRTTSWTVADPAPGAAELHPSDVFETKTWPVTSTGTRRRSALAGAQSQASPRRS
jgi:hypothetical protein